MTDTETNFSKAFDSDQIAPLRRMREILPDSLPNPEWWWDENSRGERRREGVGSYQ
jgi:hypothetical protein